MGIVSGFLAQNVIKHLLQFGQVTNYLGYSALTDYFPTMKLKPNPECEDAMCRQRQKECLEKPKSLEEAIEAKEEEKPVHTNNEWDITLIDESLDEKEDTVLHQGLKFAYSLPSENSIEECQEVKADDASLEELMTKLKSV